LAPPRRRDLYDLLWDLLTSVRVAIALIIVLTAAAFVGSLLIQPVQTVDPRLITDPEQHARFLDFARQRYGFLAGAVAPQWLRDATVIARIDNYLRSGMAFAYLQTPLVPTPDLESAIAPTRR
jgi:hypothetical protein